MTKPSEKLASSTLDASAWNEVSALYEELSGLPAHKVETRVESAELAPAAAELLRKMLHADQHQAVLDKSLDEVAEGLLELSLAPTGHMPMDLIGRRFGAWSVTEELGQGGMGAVYMAERTDGQFEKVVALKVIKPGRYSDHTRRRFLEEMRTLARLEHPNISRLVDGGIGDENIPYFAMEYVQGEPITAYADRHRLSLAARVGLLRQVCAAVEHAHQNLIVHGDLKPSNILVNAEGQVRLVDFGIARSLRADEDNLILPQFTPRYASPEQAGGRPMTTASDVFGLCAVLFELCCGAAPRDEQATTTMAQFEQSLKQPLRCAWQQLDRSPDPDHVANLRRVGAARLRRFLRGDLDWILRRGLAVDPADRLATVGDLRADLGRWLGGHAVEAHPPSRGYRLRRWSGRHKVPIAAAAAAVTALVFGTAAALNQARIAKAESARATWANEFLLDIFEEADPVLNQQQPITVNELTDGAARRLLDDSDRFAPGLKMQAAAVLGDIQVKLGQLQSAAELAKLRLQLAQSSGDQRAQAQAHVGLGAALAGLDKLGQAADHFRAALALAPLDRSVDPLAVSAAQQLALVLARVSELAEAGAWIDALLGYEAAIAALPDGAASLSFIYRTRGEIASESDQPDQAMAALERSLKYARVVGEDSRHFIDALASQASHYSDRGDAETAAALDRRVVAFFDRRYGPNHPDSINARTGLAVSLSQLGRMEQALEINREALAGYRATLGSDNQFVAGTLTNMGSAARALGQYEQALEFYQKSLAIWDRLESPPPISVAASGAGYARVLNDSGRYAEAEAMFLRSLAQFESTIGSEHPLYSRVQAFYAPVLIATGRLGQAQAMLTTAYQNVLDAYGADSTRTVIAGIPLARLLAELGERAAAVELARRAVLILDVPGLRDRHAIELAEARALLAGT